MVDDDSSSDDESSLGEFNTLLQDIKANDPSITELERNVDDMREITNEGWTKIGRAISNNTHLTCVNLYGGALNDEKMSFLFRGLTGSSSIDYFGAGGNYLSVKYGAIFTECKQS